LVGAEGFEGFFGIGGGEGRRWEDFDLFGACIGVSIVCLRCMLEDLGMDIP
jgi:hypothetical protein